MQNCAVRQTRKLVLCLVNTPSCFRLPFRSATEIFCVLLPVLFCFVFILFFCLNVVISEEFGGGYFFSLGFSLPLGSEIQCFYKFFLCRENDVLSIRQPPPNPSPHTSPDNGPPPVDSPLLSRPIPFLLVCSVDICTFCSILCVSLVVSAPPFDLSISMTKYGWADLWRV